MTEETDFQKQCRRDALELANAVITTVSDELLVLYAKGYDLNNGSGVVSMALLAAVPKVVAALEEPYRGLVARYLAEHLPVHILKLLPESERKVN